METLTKPTNTKFSDVYQEVTDEVIKALVEGTVVWQCTWNKIAFPKNITTNIDYRGWNVFWLNFHTQMKGYPAPFYITYKQAQHLGGTIKKGEKGTKIVYWATINLKDKDAESTSKSLNTDPEKQRTKMVPKAYIVFNIAQTEGIEFPPIPVIETTQFETIEACEKVIANMPNRPALNLNGNSAYYMPAIDIVVSPSLERSNSSEGYYSTLFHELAHSTGHEKRLNRKDLVDSDGFGNSGYAKEELTAEMTATFLCAICGINQPTLPNSAAYIKGWLKALKNDKTLLIKAASQAQKAADYILDNHYQTE